MSPAICGPIHRVSVARSFLGPSSCRTMSSAVIFWASRKRPRLSALHLRGTASILSPEWQHLAPCLGAALTASPLAGNVMRIGQGVHPQATEYYSSSPLSTELFRASRLASSLLFQLIRESPLHVSRTKSMPASYLTPSITGTLLGLSFLKMSNPKIIHKVLRERHGIKSNYINATHWTGVSLARWMDLIPNGALGLPGSSRSNTGLPLVSSIWLMALWELCVTKEELLDFLISLDQLLPDSEPRLLNPSNDVAQAIIHDPCARMEWADLQFDDTLDPSPDQFQMALDRLLWKGQINTDSIHSLEWTTALEKVCAMVSLNHLPLHGKPSCPTGYYGFDGGGIQADCAELTVREIINMLLWDEEKAIFDVGRLPSMASPMLVELYDEAIHPFDESGDAWFHMLSDLPGCEYLAKSPNGRPYELAPTVSNVLRALQVLLVGQGTRRVEPAWTTFQDLAEAWDAQALEVYESVLTHVSSKTGELLHHEFATLRLKNSPYRMELRLRCDQTKNSGMSKVTHLRERQSLIERDQLDALLAPEGPMAIQLLGLALGGDVPLTMRSSSLDGSNQDVAHILATPFGCDRRWLLTADMEESARVAALKESQSILKTALLGSCSRSKSDELLGAALLPWLLSEVPTVFEGKLPLERNFDPELEGALTSLPVILLGNNTVYDAMEYNWAIHGRQLAAWARCKSGASSMAHEAARLPLPDLLPFIAVALTR